MACGNSLISGANARALVLGVLALLVALPANASFHLWRIAELYSDASGNVQFVELHEAFGADFENLFQGKALTSTQGSTTRTHVVPADLPTNTANKRLLVATQAFANLNLVPPDFVIPTPFLFPGGGNLNWAGADGFTYAALPTDGVNSLDRSGTFGRNSPTNFAGQTGSIAPAPEPVRAVPTLESAALVLLVLTLMIAATSWYRRVHS